MKHVMLDLETMGVCAGCAILSIGAVYFDPKMGELGPEFYIAISDWEDGVAKGGQPKESMEDFNRHGLRIEPGTRAWWERQSPEARKVMADPKGVSLREALIDFQVWLQAYGDKDTLVYGNGADFDNPILAACYSAIGRPQPWGAYNGRCYRTLKALAPHIKLIRKGTHHNALADAKCQAEHLMEIVAGTTITLA